MAHTRTYAAAAAAVEAAQTLRGDAAIAAVEKHLVEIPGVPVEPSSVVRVVDENGEIRRRGNNPVTVPELIREIVEGTHGEAGAPGGSGIHASRVSLPLRCSTTAMRRRPSPWSFSQIVVTVPPSCCTNDFLSALVYVVRASHAATPNHSVIRLASSSRRIITLCSGHENDPNLHTNLHSFPFML